MSLPLIEWDSRNLLLEHLSKTAGSVLIGSDCESPSRFVSCRAASCLGHVEVGVVSNQSGDFVHCELLPDGNLLFIGHDQVVTVVSLAEGEVLVNERLDGVFFQFIVDEPRNQVLAVHELGVTAVSFEGDVQWRFSSVEILEDWQIAGGNIRLSAMNEGMVFVDLISGTLGKTGTDHD